MARWRPNSGEIDVLSNWQIYRTNFNGTQTELFNVAGALDQPNWSPEGNNFAWVDRSNQKISKILIANKITSFNIVGYRDPSWISEDTLLVRNDGGDIFKVTIKDDGVTSLVQLTARKFTPPESPQQQLFGN
jgi:hypothetical protein